MVESEVWIVQVKHLICEGTADATIIEKHFGVKLPDDVHDFYSKIVQCTLALRWVIKVLRQRVWWRSKSIAEALRPRWGCRPSPSA